MPARRTKLFTTIFFATVMAAYPALSCSCAIPRPIIAFGKADMIVEGKVMTVSKKYIEYESCLGRGTCGDRSVAELKVHKDLKGGAVESLSFFYDDLPEASCGLGKLEVGMSRRFALVEVADGVYGTSLCANALGYARSEEDEEFKSIDEVSKYYVENRARLLDGIATAPDSERVWIESGDLLAQFQQYDEANLSFSRALELNPASTKALIGRGAVLMAQEQYALALADFERAVRFAPQKADVIENRDHAAKCLEKMNDKKASDRVLRMRKDVFCKLGLRD